MFRSIVKRPLLNAPSTLLPRHPMAFPPSVVQARPTLPRPQSVRFFHTGYSHNNNISYAIVTGLLAAGAAAAGIFIAQDYKKAINGTKKHDPNNPLSRLNAWYAEHENDEEVRRKLGVVPAELFARGKKVFDGHYPGRSNGTWYFKQMLLVKPRPDEISFYQQAGDILLAHNHFDLAIQFWQLSMPPQAMPAQYAKIGDTYYQKNNYAKAIKYWQKAKDEGYVSYDMNMQIGYYYLTNRLDTQKAATHFFEASKITPANLSDETANLKHTREVAIALNEVGVATFMAATTFKNDTYYERQKNAIKIFETALTLCPNDPVISKNIEIAKCLNAEPYFGDPHRYLQCKLGQPTFMFDALLAQLKYYRTKTDFDIGMGTGSTPTYDNKGNYTGSSPTTTINVTPRSTTRVPNEIAIDKLLTLKMKWEYEERNVKTIEAPSAVVQPVAFKP